MNGKIPEGWRECKLGDIAIFNYGKALKEEVRINGNIPVFSSSGLSGWHNKPLVNSKGIIIGRKGTIGKIYKSDKPFYCIDTAYYVIPNDDKYDFNYLFYSLKTLGLEELNSDSAVPGLNRDAAYNQDILLPPLPEQRAIASVLSSLDDKIDLLHRQNKTLEAMAETLFRQWFVEPCKDGLPEGWEEGTLGDICTVITKGTTPTTIGHQFTNTGVNFVKAESITDTGDFVVDKFAKISEETHKFLNRSILRDGDILCSIAGTIGRIAICTIDILPANTNQAIAIIRADLEKCYPEFIYLFMKSPLFRDTMDGKIVHAVQPNLSLGEISNSTLKMPPSAYMMSFKELIRPLFLKKKYNIFQIRTLEKLRDTLLPKLMSGEVRVQV